MWAGAATLESNLALLNKTSQIKQVCVLRAQQPHSRVNAPETFSKDYKGVPGKMLIWVLLMAVRVLREPGVHLGNTRK